MNLQVTIARVSVRNTSNGKSVYDVDCGDGVTRQVWEANLANALQTFAGTNQPVGIREEVKQNGQYTNRTIKAFAPPGQALPPDNGGGQQQAISPGGNSRPFSTSMTPEDKTRIAKMAAQGTAAKLVAAFFMGAGPEAYDEAVEKMRTLTITLYKDARSHEKPETQVVLTGSQGEVLAPQAGAQSLALPVAGQAVTPAAVAAAVPGVQVGVATAQDASVEAPQADAIDWN